MVIGARNDSTTASQAGAAVVYVRSGTNWTQQAKLLANDGALGDKFGYSVAVSNNTIVIGAYNDDGDLPGHRLGLCLIRSGTTWTQQQKLTAGDGTASDEFGNAVAIQGDVIAVGAHFADLPSNAASGSVYLFQRSGTAWTSTQKLAPIPVPFPVPAGFVQKPFVNYSPILGDHFGESIAMNGGKMAVGASTSDLPATSAGAVYVFAEGGGTYALQQKLVIPEGTNGDIFGCRSHSRALRSLAERAKTTRARQVRVRRGICVRICRWPLELAREVDGHRRRNGSTASAGRWRSARTRRIGAREDDTTVGPDAGSGTYSSAAARRGSNSKGWPPPTHSTGTASERVWRSAATLTWWSAPQRKHSRARTVRVPRTPS